MRRAEGQVSLKKGADAAPSPIVPLKRAKGVQEPSRPPSQGPEPPPPGPPVFVRKMRNAAVGTGCDIRLKVTVGGDPQPSLYWYHNDQLLNMENQEYGGLWIRDCNASDAGLYTCIASNHLGETRSSAVLAVLDLGEDSETTDDEGDTPGIQESVGLVEEQTLPSVMDKCAGDDDGALDDQTSRILSEDFLRASPVLPPPSPRLVQRPSTSPMPSRSGSTTPISLRKKLLSPIDYQDTVPGEFEEKVKHPRSPSNNNGRDSRPQTPSSDYSRKEQNPRPSPKLTRASSKVFEKVRGLEERRRSLDIPEGSVSGRSWAGFNRAGSVDSDDGGSRLGISRESSREDLREALTEDAAERRTMFRQRAASLEDKPRYSQKVQDIENKFTEELQRIKKLVGKPHLKKSFSTEQLTLRGRQRQPLRKIEPIPPQVLQKLQERERVQWVKEERERELRHQQQNQQSEPQQEKTETLASPTESMQSSDLPGQRSVQSRLSPGTEILQRSSSPARQSPSRTMADITLRKVERRPPSPLVQRVTRMQETKPDSHVPTETARREETSGRKTPIDAVLRRIESRPESPLVQRSSFILPEPPPPSLPTPVRVTPVAPPDHQMEVEQSKPVVNIKVPQIIVEEEQMEEEVPAGLSEAQQKTPCSKDGQQQKIKGRSRRHRPTSPDFDSSDDSYVSAGEDPMEAPVFEVSLQDTLALAGADVLLKSVIASTPVPEVIWTKDNYDIITMGHYTVKVEGERHSLLIKSAKPSDAGLFCVTAVNQMGRAASSATLSVTAGLVQETPGNLSLPVDVSSPITSDEEYLSPLEEALDFRESRRALDSPFRQPPSFLATMSDQAVVEGQEVTMSVRITGQPKPMLYWLRDRVTVKAGPRHSVQETDDGCFTMKIQSATRWDSGVYTCRIINEYGTKQCESQLEVQARRAEPGLAVVRAVRDVSAKAGDTVLLECQVVGPKDTDVDWLTDGRLVQPALLDCKMHFDGRKCRLLLNSVHEDDSGTYTCKLSTAKEEVTSCGKLRVVPSFEPLFTRKLDVLEVIEGRNARFDCKVSGTPPPTVTWTHFDHALMDSDDVRIVQEGGRHSLLISHVTNEDEGFYTVTARNPHGHAETSAELYIQEPRPAISSQMAKLEKMPSIPEEPEVPENEVERFTMPDFIKPLYDLDVIQGKEAGLKCKVAGLPYPTIAWFHNGKRIESTDERKMTQFRDVHSLVIRSVVHAHGGVYKSVISNKVGKATCYAHLYVTDILPDPPDGTPVIEAITGKTITLSWKKPRRLDAAIDPASLMYAVQQQALGSIQWTIIVSGLKETSATISSLSKGVRYSFRVLTITSKTFSKPSPPTEPTQLHDRGPYLQEAPVIVDRPDVVFVIEGQSVSAAVTLNHVNAAVVWRRNGVPLTNRRGQYEMTMPDDDQHTLTLLAVRNADVGLMEFIASNSFGSDSCTFTVELAAPPTFENIMEDIDVCSGETPRFAVVVEGRPLPDILWFKNDALLVESSHYTFVYDDSECSLVVLNAHPEDSGVYTCTARNLAGSVSCKAELTVHQAKLKAEPTDDEETTTRKMRRLSDYYDVHKEIGRGAFSFVKRVTLKAGKREFAAKFIWTGAQQKVSALQELELLSRLDNQSILYFHDAFQKKNAVVIVSEICHEEMLDRFTRKPAVLESDVCSCIRQVVEGVDYLHHLDIVHLDIKPENILMADAHSDRLRLCDFGNAVKLTPDEAQYCKYGTPEFVAPEIVNQTPVSKATDIWPVGVLVYLCLTGISPFAGENDRSSVLNIRNYNVAFEENMFSDISKEAKGFIIKLLVADGLRPNTQECLRHPWFKTISKGKNISMEPLKKFLSRRKWQRSLISYKSKMVMTSIPELLNESSNHISIAVPRRLKEGSPVPSSSSDSDEDIDELPFIPKPLNMDFSESRMSLNEIQSNEEEIEKTNGDSKLSESSAQEAVGCDAKEMDEGVEVASKLRKRSTQDNDKGSSDDESPAELSQKTSRIRKPLRRGGSMESDKPEAARRRGELRRGGSADSALLLRITPEEGAKEGSEEDDRRVLKKAVSLELPRRSSSPGTAKMSQEDYALKLELMRQRLLRGGSVDNKLSGLRGPLLETLGMGDEKRSISSDRYSRTARLAPPLLTRAASSDFPRDEVPKPKVLRKSTSFSQGDSEPITLHRRSGAPLEIPVAQVEERKLKEAMSMSSLTEQLKLESRPVTPRDPSPKPPMPESVVQAGPTKTESEESLMEREPRLDEGISEKMDGLTTDSNFDERSSTSGFSEKDMSISEEPIIESECRGPTPPAVIQSSEPEEKSATEEEEQKTEEEERDGEVKGQEKKMETVQECEADISQEVKANLPSSSPEINITTSSLVVRPSEEHSFSTETVPAIVPPSPPTRVVLPDGRTSAYASIMQTIMVPSRQSPSDAQLGPSIPVDAPSSILSETSASDGPGPSKPVPVSTTEHAAVYARVASPETISKEPSPPKTSEHSSTPQELTAGGEFEDITSEEIFETRFKKRESSLTRSLKFLSRSKNEEKSRAPASDSTETGEEIYRPGPIGAPLQLAPRRLEEKSKSVQDLREAQKDQGFMRRLSMRLKRTPSAERKDEGAKEEDSSVSQRRLSWTLGRKGSQERKEVEMMRMDGGGNKVVEPNEKDLKKPNESPVLAMRRKIESTVAGISTRIRSYSEERRASEDKETKRTPILSMLRRSASENRGLKVAVPQNQLASQSHNGASSESLDSMSSQKSDTSKGVEAERRSRWDRWGLTRGRRDKTVSQPDIPTAISRENSSLRSRQYSKLAADFPPVFHIKLRDHVLLEGDPVTLSCLPAGSPPPHITWIKDRKPLEVEARMNTIGCPDGRQLLMIMQTTKKDAGVYECVATNPLASMSSSCTISLARLPNRPGTPESPQRYNNTALVVWRPSDFMAPCTYSLERRAEGDSNWLMVATGVADCYYNVTELPAGGAFRFRVACVNKAGQGPYSHLSKVVTLEAAEPVKSSATPPPPPMVMMSSMKVTPIKLSPSKTTAAPSAQPLPPCTLAPTVTPPPPVSPPPVPQTPVTPPTADQSSASAQALPTTKAKSSISISMSKPQAKGPLPPTVPPKPHSPALTLPHIPNKPPSPGPPPPHVIGKPISSVPLYVAAATARVTPTSPLAPVPPVGVTSAGGVVQSVTTVLHGGESRGALSGRVTPSGRRTPLGKPGEGSLRQGVPQKPYTFMDEKARGRFGVIRECRENATGNIFMAKIVPYETDSKQAVLQEYDILKSLHHERIMALHEAYVTPRYLVLISEFCSGKELLYSLIDRFRYSEDDVVTYIVQILQGLDYLHTRRILHLDIKPENMMVTHMNVVKIIDFGSAQTFNPLFLKQFSPPIGTLEHMSPEMVKGDVVGPPADVWSVGVLAFIMLSGKSPFMEVEPQETQARIQAAKMDLSKLYQNVSQSASLFLKKILCSYPWARPSIKDCFGNSWLQDAYLMRLRRQTLTFTTSQLKEFVGEQQRRRALLATKHKVLLRSYQSSPQSPASPTPPTVPTAPTTPVSP